VIQAEGVSDKVEDDPPSERFVRVHVLVIKRYRREGGSMNAQGTELACRSQKDLTTEAIVNHTINAEQNAFSIEPCGNSH
jgi:hypothetical protein